MPVQISTNEGTLQGFDIVLALSEEAINANLQKLYDTNITNGPLPPPTIIPNFKTLPQAEHFINHRLSIHQLNTKKSTPGDPVYLKSGIEGWIECPKLRFRPILDLGQAISADARYKNAYVEITFKKGLDGKDSSLIFYDQETETYDEKSLTGKTIAWAVKIGRLDVQDVMNDIVKKTVHDPPADERLKQFVDSNVFTVSTIYCLFEHQEMINSFTILDENRKVVKGDVVASAMDHLTAYFLGIQQTHGSAQVPENPFILGYGISQKPPQESSDKARENQKKTLPYFIPKQFVLTVTPGDGLNQKWSTTSGTINYCMLTQRQGQYDRVDISPADANAGLFEKTFFDITKTLGKTKDDTGKVQGHDGIMAFSRGIMENLWLEKIIREVRTPLDNSFRDMLNAGFWKPVGFAQLLVSSGDGLTKVTGGWKSHRLWQTDPVGMDESDPYSKQQFAFGESLVQIKLDSETAKISSVMDGINHARNLYLDIKVENVMTYVFQTHGINTWLTKADDDKNWLNSHGGNSYPDWNKIRAYLWDDGWMLARTLELTVRSLIRIKIHAGANGQWDIDVDEAASKNLFKEGEDLKFDATNYQGLPSFDNIPDNGYGNYYELTKHNTYKSFGTKDADEHFKDSMKGWKSEPAKKIRQSIKGITEGLGESVIMPAGDVFTFAGLDTDAQGTVYAQCNYANESGHIITK